MPGLPVTDEFVTGCFGKLPARGDFVLRGLPRAFADPWHDWLVEGLRRSRDAMGAGWLASYLNAPIWRFAIDAGICGPQPAVGILMASVDKTGRYFPLTIAALLAQGDAGNDAAWFDAAEELAFTALAPTLDVEGFVGTVEALAPPSLVPSSASAGTPCARWWTLGGEGVAAQSLTTAGLPDPAGFGGFLTGFTQSSGEATAP